MVVWPCEPLVHIVLLYKLNGQPWFVFRRNGTGSEVIMVTPGLDLTLAVFLRRISYVGIYVASMITGKGPYSLLLEHVQDPIHHNAVQNLL